MPESPLPPATPRSNRTSGVPSPMSGGPGGNATGASTPGSRLSDRAAAFESPSKAAQALRAGQIPDEGYERQLRAVALLAEMLVLEDMNYAPEPLASSRVVPFEMLSTNPCMAMLSSYDTQLVYHALQVTQNLTLETDRDTGALWVGSVVEGCWPTNATAVVHLGVPATTPLDEVMGIVQQYTKQHIWVIWLGPMTVGAQDATWYLGFSCGAAAVAALRDLTPLQFVEVRDGSRVSFRVGPKQTSARSQSRINASFAYLGKIIHTVAPRRVQQPGPRSTSPVTTTRRARSAGRRPWTPTQLPARSSSAQPRSTSRRSRSATAKPVANADANDARQNTTASNNDANNNQPLRVMKRRQAEPPAPLTDAVATTPPPDPRLPSANQSAPPQVMPQGYVSRRAASLEQRFNGGHAAPPHAETTGQRPPVVTRVNRPYAVGAHTVTNASGDARSDVARSDVSTAASRQRRPPSRNCTVPSIQSATAHWFHWWWWGAAQRYGYLLDQDSWAFEAAQQQPPPTRQISTALNARNVRRETAAGVTDTMALNARNVRRELAVSVTEDGSQVKIRRRRFRNKKTAESAAGLPPSTEPINKSWADEPTSVPGIDDVPTPSAASEGEHAADVQPPTTTATGVEEGAHQASPSPPVEAEPAPPAAPKLSFADMIRQRNTNRPATAPEKAAQVTPSKGVTDDVRNTNGPRNGGTAPQQLRDAASAKSKPAAKSSRVAQRA